MALLAVPAAQSASAADLSLADPAGRWATPGSICHAELRAGESEAAVAATASRWTCDQGDWQADAETMLLRFDMRGQSVADPVLTLSNRLFDSLSITAASENGNLRRENMSADDLSVSSPVWRFTHAVAVPSGRLSAIIVRFDGVQIAPRLAPTRISDGQPSVPIATLDQIVAALLAGLLLAPILFDLGFQRVLRKSFPLYHALFCAMAVVQTLAVSGLLTLLLGVGQGTQHVVAQLSFDMTVAAGTLFAASFIEREQLGDRGRTILRAIAVLAVSLGIARLLLADALGVAVMQIYYGGYAIFIVGLCAALARPLRGASRALRFVLLSYLPLLAIGIARIGSALTTNMADTLPMVQAQHLALAWQITVSAFAVADRFMTLKRERDRARTAAEVAERASERDPLTGLLNRRALQRKYAALREEGFTTLAVLDLDHFKRVNDRHGHTVGDQVLKCVAEAITPSHGDTMAFRMGGEEFVLLLRGEDALCRAEAKRRSIAERIAESGLVDTAVTASMGLVEVPPGTLADTGFDALYERADRLLYEAKAAGRDRTMSERLRVFHPRRGEDRRIAA
ncbi:GGDEF domain-containing protein [Aurantiacibacter luteus]|uniref:GGDEF domain-containing protein n=1 Tax=Aurantiacibacter luteus TaxID=1581420 RepID=UPI00138E4AC0|nr:GGDEF domain-containing protein [Aurantiacibacter luteus]